MIFLLPITHYSLQYQNLSMLYSHPFILPWSSSADASPLYTRIFPLFSASPHSEAAGIWRWWFLAHALSQRSWWHTGNSSRTKNKNWWINVPDPHFLVRQHEICSPVLRRSPAGLTWVTGSGSSHTNMRFIGFLSLLPSFLTPSQCFLETIS